MPSAAAMQAETDQALAQVAAHRRRPPDLAAKFTLPIAGDLASALADEFGKNAGMAGRVLVSAAAKILGLAAELDSNGVEPAQVTRVMLNVLAFAGEQLHREAS